MELRIQLVSSLISISCQLMVSYVSPWEREKPRRDRLFFMLCGLLCLQAASAQRTRIASPRGDLRLSGPPSGQGAGGGPRTCDRRVLADLRANSLATVPLSFLWSAPCLAYSRRSGVKFYIILLPLN
ncbi:retinol dehydrogenase 16 [Plakobranchus ocellatus]|uniref:Retinol dehydrogenase 16 n=1 Tax=Plakobranchus ocellatus TaxID=259542 RepID=A0AAV3Y0X9_9GAST|nr:retinol dehydrogenase 16 [Plakobranchus ocellatus]